MTLDTQKGVAAILERLASLAVLKELPAFREWTGLDEKLANAGSRRIGGQEQQPSSSEGAKYINFFR